MSPVNYSIIFTVLLFLLHYSENIVTKPRGFLTLHLFQKKKYIYNFLPEGCYPVVDTKYIKNTILFSVYAAELPVSCW